MQTIFRQILLPAIAVAFLLAGRASAGDCCCSHCGCASSCQKVCRLVCEEKKVEIICWGCKCEDFCVPKRSTPGCTHCEEVCGACGEACDCKTPHAKPKRFVWTDWAPGCAKMYTKKKLMQKIVTKKVPSYKWVVEDLCPNCEASCACAAVPPDAQFPPPPIADAKLIYDQSRVAMQPAPGVLR